MSRRSTTSHKLSPAKEAIHSCLVWYEKDKRFEKQDVEEKDLRVRQLCYQPSGRDPVLMGTVCKQRKGKSGFWWFIDNHDIKCRYETVGLENISLDDACDQLYEHVFSEIYRQMKASLPCSARARFKLSDTDLHASSLYLARHFREKGVTGEDNFYGVGFHHGVDYSMKSQGIGRRPEWAKYVVQNRDGSIWWFEHQPKILKIQGKWEVRKGRCEQAKVAEDWECSLQRVDFKLPKD
jgi:hypothetical protein